MMGMAKKESGKKSIQGSEKRLEKTRRKFWAKTLDTLRKRGVARYANISPFNRGSLASTKGLPDDCEYNLRSYTDNVGVELRFKRSEDDNKWMFDRLKRERREIEERFGAEMLWERLDGKKASWIRYSLNLNDDFHTENWPSRIEWLCEHIVKLEEAFSEPLARLGRELESLDAADLADPADSTADASAPDA